MSAGRTAVLEPGSIVDVARYLIVDAAELVYAHNRTATRDALEAGMTGGPGLDEALVARAAPSNPYFRGPA